jgi:hypothetical protein
MVSVTESWGGSPADIFRPCVFFLLGQFDGKKYWGMVNSLAHDRPMAAGEDARPQPAELATTLSKEELEMFKLMVIRPSLFCANGCQLQIIRMCVAAPSLLQRCCVRDSQSCASFYIAVCLMHCNSAGPSYLTVTICHHFVSFLCPAADRADSGGG